MTRLNWLHISDVHIKAEGFDLNTVLTALLRDVQDRTSKIDPCLDKIDLVFLTGDLVFSGREEEYELAYEVLIEPLTRELGIVNLSQRVFVVPGNHDVDLDSTGIMRESIRQMLSHGDTRAEVQDLLSNDTESELILAPQTAYFEFFSDTFDGIELASPCKHYVYRSAIEGRGYIAVVGLNSAWLANGGSEDQGRLILGEPQVGKALTCCANTDFVISLLHHPLDWLNPSNSDTGQCRSRLIERSCVILHGHLHTPNVAVTTSLEGDTTFIPAGAVFTTRNAPLSFNYVSLDLDSGAGTVFFRRYSDPRREWVKDVESTGDAADGKGSFSTRPLQSTSEAPAAETVQLVLDDEEEGFLDWAIQMEDAGNELLELMQKAGNSAEIATNKMNLSVERLHGVGHDIRRARVVIRQMATGMTEFAEEIDETAAEMGSQWQSFYESFRPFLSLESGELKHWLRVSGDVELYAEQAISVTATIETVVGQIDGLWVGIGGSRSSVVELRGVDRSLNRAVRDITPKTCTSE